MEKAAGEGAPARATERRQPEREEHGEERRGPRERASQSAEREREAAL